MRRIVIEVVTAKVSYYRFISEENLNSLFEIQDLTERKQKLWDLSEPKAIVADNQVEAVVVVDGREDAESWKELQEYLNS